MPIAIVSGALANKPLNGGEAWVRLSWVLGLERLGFETYFVEQLNTASCVDGEGRSTEFETSANRAYFERVTADFGLGGRSALFCEDGDSSTGLSLAEVERLAGDAELLVNVSGHLTIPSIVSAARVSLYVDVDPGFTQLWHLDPELSFAIAEHDRYATVALNLGKPVCRIPDCGIEWMATLPPVLSAEWPAAAPPSGPPRFTTVAGWRSPFGAPTLDGRRLGLKHHAFRRLVQLPERVPDAVFELALDVHRADVVDRRALEGHGWRLVEPREVAATPQDFRAYVAASTAEFSVAQGVYAETGSGWFSDRTAAYLACGRPAVVEETGIAESIAPGEGLLTFSSLEQAIESVELAMHDLPRRSAAAGAFASSHLDSDVVLGSLLTELGIGA